MDDRGLFGKHRGRPLQERERRQRLEVRGIAVEIGVVRGLGQGRGPFPVTPSLAPSWKGGNRFCEPIACVLAAWQMMARRPMKTRSCSVASARLSWLRTRTLHRGDRRRQRHTILL